MTDETVSQDTFREFPIQVRAAAMKWLLTTEAGKRFHRAQADVWLATEEGREWLQRQKNKWVTAGALVAFIGGVIFGIAWQAIVHGRH